MALNRRLLAKVDRRLLSELDHTDGVQLVKVPVSHAVWSTWRRYCDAVGVPMGRGLAILLHHELATLVGVDLERLGEMLDAREARIVAWEAELNEREQELERRETEVTVQERRVAAEAAKVSRAQSESWTPPKRGRNEPCWCGSGKKFKYCHGRT
jgi:uncharacterized protein YchJ